MRIESSQGLLNSIVSEITQELLYAVPCAPRDAEGLVSPRPQSRQLRNSSLVRAWHPLVISLRRSNLPHTHSSSSSATSNSVIDRRKDRNPVVLTHPTILPKLLHDMEEKDIVLLIRPARNSSRTSNNAPSQQKCVTKGLEDESTVAADSSSGVQETLRTSKAVGAIEDDEVSSRSGGNDDDDEILKCVGDDAASELYRDSEEFHIMTAVAPAAPLLLSLLHMSADLLTTPQRQHLHTAITQVLTVSPTSVTEDIAIKNDRVCAEYWLALSSFLLLDSERPPGVFRPLPAECECGCDGCINNDVVSMSTFTEGSTISVCELLDFDDYRQHYHHRQQQYHYQRQFSVTTVVDSLPWKATVSQLSQTISRDLVCK